MIAERVVGPVLGLANPPPEILGAKPFQRLGYAAVLTRDTLAAQPERYHT